ncbi:unnamed protein product [Anisakis simplex]|uniref:Probable RNA-binding protein EIF1AD n=1 Tax=Anisakis simplex TaxID=6269 RepID=A0A0M3JYH8_ANISI|nr:unnamed protein product [Anisakis simplex]
MSIASKRRFVTKQVESEYVLPGKGEIIGKVLAGRGNNLHEVEDANGEKYLASMPTKFRKSVWVKRGQFVLLQAIEEGDKVKAEITNVLDDENVLHIREEELWPQRFEQDAEKLTREAKRHVNVENKKHQVIDADMLPPSDSESSEEDEDEEAEDDQDSADDKSNLVSFGFNKKNFMLTFFSEKPNETGDNTDSDGSGSDASGEGHHDEETSDEEDGGGERPIIDVYNPNRIIKNQ